MDKYKINKKDTQNKRTLFISIALISSIILFSGCLDIGVKDKFPSDEMTADIEVISANGTVIHVDLEGGFYGIVTDKGDRYYPLNMDEIYAENGMDITFVGKVKEDTVTAQMWGTPVEIISMSERSEADFVYGYGTVTYIELEGGFYGIITDEQDRYLPLNLEERYKMDGMRVFYAGELKHDIFTIYQWGTPLEIHSILWAYYSPDYNVSVIRSLMDALIDDEAQTYHLIEDRTQAGFSSFVEGYDSHVTFMFIPEYRDSSTYYANYSILKNDLTMVSYSNKKFENISLDDPITINVPWEKGDRLEFIISLKDSEGTEVYTGHYNLALGISSLV
ncbi:hypothetical protein [Methanosalsum zhilinae]|nr:hypothetical protein [Methanosalsum zhilinae]